MPGHKLGKGIPDRFLNNLHLLDITEIPGLDNLHFPQGIIKEAQDLAADAFGADYTSFLVNGSTCGVHAAILSLCKQGDKLIVARDCHKSVVGAMMLAGVTPIYVKPEYDSSFGIPSLMLPSAIAQAFDDNPDAIGVIMSRPNYYGLCSDIVAISNVVHSRNKTLIVDEAHGAHLRFSPKLPCCALDADADVCIQSAHKTLPALTQGAYIHIKGNRVDVDRLKFVLQLIQTSSPSYIIMAFLDIARAIMQSKGNQLLEDLLNKVSWFETLLCGNTGFKMLSSNQTDKTRLVINVKNTGVSGFFVEKLLREQFNIQVEMSDAFNIVCIATVADQANAFEGLYFALNKIDKQFKGSQATPEIELGDLPIPYQAVALNKVMEHPYKKVHLSHSEGLVCKSIITPYPPGIPIICPGEVITQEAIKYINSVLNAGGTVNGLSNNLTLEALVEE